MMKNNANENIKFSAPQLSVNFKKINFKPDAHTRGIHYHSEIELVKVNSGSVMCSIGSDDFVLPKGKILFINKLVLHKIYYYKNDADCTFLQIDTDKYRSLIIPSGNNHLIRFINQEGIIPYCVFDLNDEIAIIFDEICHEFEEKNTAFDIYIKSKIFSIIAFMCRNNLAISDEMPSSMKYIDKIMPAIEYAETNYGKKIHLDELCKEMNIDKYYFCKLFKKATGAGFSDYINYLRIYHAENLLLSSDKNISDIAYLCGFNSIQYFNRIFKEHKGYSPREFRKIKY